MTKPRISTIDRYPRMDWLRKLCTNAMSGMSFLICSKGLALPRYAICYGKIGTELLYAIVVSYSASTFHAKCVCGIAVSPAHASGWVWVPGASRTIRALMRVLHKTCFKRLLQNMRVCIRRAYKR